MTLSLQRSDFKIYQDAMYKMALDPVAADTRSTALWVGMGGGKTVVGLTVADDLLNLGAVGKVLVVSTKKAAEHTWATEHKHWAHLKDQGEETVLLFGTPAQRQAKLKTGYVHIINQENLPWLVKGYGKNWPYEMLIVDDCKGLKKPSSQTFKFMRRVLPMTRRVLILNGTPMPNGYLQLWPQIYLLDKGKRLGKTMTAYRDRFFYPDYGGWNWNLKEGAEEKIRELIKDIVYSVDVDKYLDLKVPEDFILPVYLPTKLRDQYNQLEKEYMLVVEDETVEALSAAVLQNKLAQLCNGALYTDPLDPSSPYKVVHDLKLEALDSVMSESAGENIIVAYNYDTDWQRIKKKFKYAVHANDDKAIERWNKGEVKMLCCHPASAGHGLNLQYGGRTIVWFGSEWSLELNLQMDERIGAKRQALSKLNMTPRYIRIAVHNSIEQRIAHAVQQKCETQDELLESVRLL